MTDEIQETEGEAVPEALGESEQIARFATYAKQEKRLKKWKVRMIAFDRRKVCRAMQDFEHDGKNYKAGEIFDWVALKMKPYFVARLYARKMIRHVVEDNRVSYPFRDLRNDANKNAPEAPTEAEAPEADNEEQEGEDAPEAPESGADDIEKPAAKFSKKNAHKRK